MTQPRTNGRYPSMHNRVLPKRPTDGLTNPSALQQAIVNGLPNLHNKRVLGVNLPDQWLLQYAVNAGADAVLGISHHRHQVDDDRATVAPQLRYRLLPVNHWQAVTGHYDVLVALVSTNAELMAVAGTSGTLDPKHGIVTIINSGLNMKTIRRTLTDPHECRGQKWVENGATTNDLITFRPQRK